MVLEFVIASAFISFIVLGFVILNSVSSPELFAQETLIKMDNATLEKLVGEYGNWSANVGKNRTDAGDPCVIKEGSVNFLLDPYQQGKVFQTCDINSGSQFLFPFLYGWADTASAGYEDANLSKLTKGAFDANIGIITMKAWLDGVMIVNVEVKNEGQNNIKTINHLPQSNYYKEILTHNTFELTKAFDLSCPKMPELNTPQKCKAIALCFCGFLSNVTAAEHKQDNQPDHKLEYMTKIAGSSAFQGADEINDYVTYNFYVK